MHTYLPLVTTSLIMTSAILVAIGWRLIRKQKREQHRRVMLTAAGFATAFFILYVTRTAVSGDLAFGGPDYLRVPYLILSIDTHRLVNGICRIRHRHDPSRLKEGELRQASRDRKSTTATMWFFTTLSGFAVYVLLYVLFPGKSAASGMRYFKAR